MWRYELIQHYIDEYEYKKYLEIGLGPDCYNFKQINVSLKIGVDPYRSHAIDSIVNESVLYYEMDSNTFLSKHQDVLKDVDIVFIDGLHEYHQVYHECTTLMQYMKVGGTIMIHDCNPFTEEMAIPVSELNEYDRLKEPWMGDVWKAIVMLRQVYPEWEVFVADTDCGIGIIRKNKEYGIKTIPNNIKQEVEALCYLDLDKNRMSLLNLKPILNKP